MSYAPDGRMLSPGEVLEETVVEVKPQAWQEDLNVLLMCPDCRENPVRSLHRLHSLWNVG
jgi:transcription initiation factor TFIIB